MTMIQMASDRERWCCGMITRDGWVIEAAPKIRKLVVGTMVDGAVQFLADRHGARVIAWWWLP